MSYATRRARRSLVLLLGGLLGLAFFATQIGAMAGVTTDLTTDPTPVAYLPGIFLNAPMPYSMQNDHPAYMENWANTKGCQWLGVAGQVYDLNGRSVQGLYVHLEGGGLNVDAPTGAKPAYGPGGYEIYLADHVVTTTTTYKLQLRDAVGNSLSVWYFIPTFEDCAKNLILVNFVQNYAMPTPGVTPTPALTLVPYNYTMQNGHPTYMQNWANTAGCAWLGIAGQVHDLNGRSVQGLYVHLEGGGLNVDAPTGAKPAYGPGGYELYLTDHVVTTTDMYKIQLRDAAGKPLSDWYTIPTYADCAKNLILVNFEQNH